MLGSVTGQVRFRTTVEAVRVPVMVNHRGKPVVDLTARDFELQDNGISQVVEVAARDEVALDVVLALDTSSSVFRAQLDSSLKEAAVAALGELRTADRAAFISFSHRVSLESPFTHDLGSLVRLMYRPDQGGGTALCDAAIAAVIAAEPRAYRRTLLILYTDGNDTTSWHSPTEVLSTADRSEVVVFAVVPRDDRRLRLPSRLGQYPTTWSFLSELTNRTGGELIPVKTGRLAESFRAVVRQFAQGYQLLFYPKGVEKGGWHSVRVTLRGRAGTVRARHGYHAD